MKPPPKLCKCGCGLVVPISTTHNYKGRLFFDTKHRCNYYARIERDKQRAAGAKTEYNRQRVDDRLDRVFREVAEVRFKLYGDLTKRVSEEEVRRRLLEQFPDEMREVERSDL